MSVALVGGSQPALERLRASSDVRVIAPGDPGFDEARMAWNRAHEHHPLAVAIVGSTRGVVEIVTAARDSGVPVAIQASGHGPTRVADGAILFGAPPAELSALYDITTAIGNALETCDSDELIAVAEDCVAAQDLADNSDRRPGSGPTADQRRRNGSEGVASRAAPDRGSPRRPRVDA